MIHGGRSARISCLAKALEDSRAQQSSRWHLQLSSLVDNNTELA